MKKNKITIPHIRWTVVVYELRYIQSSAYNYRRAA